MPNAPAIFILERIAKAQALASHRYNAKRLRYASLPGTLASAGHRLRRPI